MKRFSLATLLALCLFVPTALASDDSQTQPHLDYGAVIFPNTSTDLIATTNGTGNIKGIQCRFVNGVQGTINIFVNGGSAQALTLKGSSFPVDVNGENFPDGYRLTCASRVVFVFSCRKALRLAKYRVPSVGDLIDTGLGRASAALGNEMRAGRNPDLQSVRIRYFSYCIQTVR